MSVSLLENKGVCFYTINRFFAPQRNRNIILLVSKYWKSCFRGVRFAKFSGGAYPRISLDFPPLTFVAPACGARSLLLGRTNFSVLPPALRKYYGLAYYSNLECTRCCYSEYALFYILWDIVRVDQNSIRKMEQSTKQNNKSTSNNAYGKMSHKQDQ